MNKKNLEQTELSYYGLYLLEKPNKFDPFGQKELTLLATI